MLLESNQKKSRLRSCAILLIILFYQRDDTDFTELFLSHTESTDFTE